MTTPDASPATLSSRTFLGLGSNLGDRLARLQESLDALRDRRIRPLAVSSVYDTDPVGILSQGNFLNLALEVEWPGDPRALLERCQDIERSAGRVRGPRDGPRTLDIDILLCGQRILGTPGLEIPHPRLHVRRFVLVPLAEIAPSVIHPVLGLTVAELLKGCPDLSGVRAASGRLRLERVDPSGYNPAASRGK